jgi:hypothetical protein
MHYHCQVIASPDNGLEPAKVSDQVGQLLFLEASMRMWSSGYAATHDPELHNVVKCKSSPLERFKKNPQ